MNKINSTTGLMTAVLVGMTLSHAPVQAGCDMKTAKHVVGVAWSQTKKASKVVFKLAKIGVESSLFVLGSVLIGATLDPTNNTKFVNSSGASFRGVLLGAGLSVSVLSALFLYKELFGGNKANNNEQKKS